jgi:hypothetical protein
MRLEMRARGTHRVLLRVTPAVPRSLHRRFDKLEPLLLARVVGGRWQREDLPPPVIADHGHHRLSAWPAGVAIGPRVVGIGSHQSLLNGEDQIVCGMQCGRGQRWIVASKPDLQGSDRLAQWRRCLRLIA